MIIKDQPSYDTIKKTLRTEVFVTAMAGFGTYPNNEPIRILFNRLTDLYADAYFGVEGSNRASQYWFTSELMSLSFRILGLLKERWPSGKNTEERWSNIHMQLHWHAANLAVIRHLMAT